MERLVKEFIKENIKTIVKEGLSEQLILHLITLFDAQQLEKVQLVDIMRYFKKEKEKE